MVGKGSGRGSLRVGQFLAFFGVVAIGLGAAALGHMELTRHNGSDASAAATGCNAPIAGTTPPALIKTHMATAMAFSPDGRLWYTDRDGKVYVWQNGAAHVFANVPTTVTQRDGGYSEFGNNGLAISPTFGSDHYVYAMYTDNDYLHEDVVRWTECRGVASGFTMLVQLPAPQGCCHVGGRIKFGPDNELYVSLGEESTSGPPRKGYVPLAQLTSTPLGKIMRYNPDGSVPADNPFGPTNPAWAMGLRNPFGLAFNDTGQMLITVNGPSGEAGSPKSGYDTVILAQRGANYEWPYCYGYSHPIDGYGLRHPCGVGGVAPDWSSEKPDGSYFTVVPAGAAWILPGGPSDLVGHWVVCTVYKGMQIMTPSSPHWSATWSGNMGCQLDIAQAPDGTVYYSDYLAIHRAGAKS